MRILSRADLVEKPLSPLIFNCNCAPGHFLYFLMPPSGPWTGCWRLPWVEPPPSGTAPIKPFLSFLASPVCNSLVPLPFLLTPSPNQIIFVLNPEIREENVSDFLCLPHKQLFSSSSFFHNNIAFEMSNCSAYIITVISLIQQLFTQALLDGGSLRSNVSSRSVSNLIWALLLVCSSGWCLSYSCFC